MLESASSFSLVYTVSKDLWRALRGRRRTATPEEILARRQQWKSTFEREIWRRHANRFRRDAIIRDVRRIDHYPDVNDKANGISPWFRSDLVGTYHKGILVGLRWEELKRTDHPDEWRYINYKSGENGDINLLLVGRIPYENIENVDWQGDEYYPLPHIYCHFDARKREPYESLAFCSENRYRNEQPSYVEVVRYEQVREVTNKFRIPTVF
jgi:hypothetical protein